MQPLTLTNDDLTRHYAVALDALCEIARSYFFLGRLEEAVSLLRTSLHLIEAGEVAPQDRLKLLLLFSESHFGIGLVYQFWQQNDLAREHFTRAIQAAEQGGHILEQAEPHRHLTFDALFRGDLAVALTHALRALSFREAGGFRPYQPFDHLTLRDIYLKQGDIARAEFHLHQASALAEAMGFPTLVSSLVQTMNQLGTQPEEA